MRRDDFKLDLDMDALSRVVNDGMRDMARSGQLEMECPYCGLIITLQTPETTCPHCGESFRVELKKMSL